MKIYIVQEDRTNRFLNSFKKKAKAIELAQKENGYVFMIDCNRVEKDGSLVVKTIWPTALDILTGLTA